MKDGGEAWRAVKGLRGEKRKRGILNYGRGVRSFVFSLERLLQEQILLRGL